jgi:hypothetical protein
MLKITNRRTNYVMAKVNVSGIKIPFTLYFHFRNTITTSTYVQLQSLLASE